MKPSLTHRLSRRGGAGVLALIVGATLMLSGCAVESNKPSPSSSPLTRTLPLTGASSVATAPPASSAPFQLTVLHTNDTWGYLIPCG